MKVLNWRSYAWRMSGVLLMCFLNLIILIPTTLLIPPMLGIIEVYFICIYVYLYVCMYLPLLIHTHTYTYIHTYIHTQIYTYIHKYTHTCLHGCNYALEGFFAGLPRNYGACTDIGKGQYICKYNNKVAGLHVLRVSVEEPGLNASYFNTTDFGTFAALK